MPDVRNTMSRRGDFGPNREGYEDEGAPVKYWLHRSPLPLSTMSKP